MTWILSLIVPVVIVVQKIAVLRWNLYKSIEFKWSLVDTKLRTKVSFGGVLDTAGYNVPSRFIFPPQLFEA